MGLAVGMAWQSMQSRVTPYVVEVDRLGEVRAVAPATETYQPTDAQIAWHLGRFIASVRGVSVDPVLVRRNWLDASDFAPDRDAAFLNDYARPNDPVAAIRSEESRVGKECSHPGTSRWLPNIYKQNKYRQ